MIIAKYHETLEKDSSPKLLTDNDWNICNLKQWRILEDNTRARPRGWRPASDFSWSALRPRLRASISLKPWWLERHIFCIHGMRNGSKWRGQIGQRWQGWFQTFPTEVDSISFASGSTVTRCDSIVLIWGWVKAYCSYYCNIIITIFWEMNIQPVVF